MDQPDDPRHRLRVSDADREHVAEILRAAAGDGRLDSDELDERLGAAYGAKTVGDLVPLTSDLPEAPPLPRARPDKPSAEPAQDDSQVTHEPAGPERGVAIMSGFERRGDWLVPPQLTVTAVMGGAHIDTRRARFSADEVVITVYAVMGGAEIVVGPRTRVVVEGNGIMGGFSAPPEGQPDTSAPVVRVRGVAFWGGVGVTRKE